MTNYKKVLLIGDGAVGSTFAYSLLQNCPIDELVLVDVRTAHAEGDASDLEDVTSMMAPAIVHAGSYADAADADIVVITAGSPRKAGESRLDLVNKNTQILKSIISPVVESGFEGCFVVSANPVDILTALTQRLSGFPKQRVIGTGTSLDTARLRVALAKEFRVSTDDVNAYVLGEHGDSSFVAYDEASIKGQLIKSYDVNEQRLMDIEIEIRKKGANIIAQKGATFYGVATSLMKICHAILTNEAIVLPVSAPLDGEYGLDKIYLGTPAVIDGLGIHSVIEVPLSEDEHLKMERSAATLNDALMTSESE